MSKLTEDGEEAVLGFLKVVGMMAAAVDGVNGAVLGDSIGSGSQ
jgi:hypothetical protein